MMIKTAGITNDRQIRRLQIIVRRVSKYTFLTCERALARMFFHRLNVMMLLTSLCYLP